MSFAKRVLALVGCFTFGILTSGVQSLKQQNAKIEKIVTPENLEQYDAQIKEDATVKIIVKASDGSVNSGSGFFVRQDLIVINIHVVVGIYGKPFTRHAKLVDQSVEYTIKGVMASDPEHDLVILKVEVKGENVLRFGGGDTVKIGEKVIAIGIHGNASSKVVKGTISRITTDSSV